MTARAAVLVLLALAAPLAVAGPAAALEAGPAATIAEAYAEGRAAAAQALLAPSLAPAAPPLRPPPADPADEGQANAFLDAMVRAPRPAVAWALAGLGEPVLPDEPPLVPRLDAADEFAGDTAFQGGDAALALAARALADLDRVG